MVKLKKKESGQSNYIDTTYNQLLANINGDFYQVYFNMDCLPKSFTQTLLSRQKLTITVRPFDMNHQTFLKTYSYQSDNFFYISSPFLSNIVDIPKIDSQTQSLKGWSITDDITNTSNKLLEKQNVLKDKNQLKNIFNIIYLNHKPYEKYVFNSFQSIPKELYHSPIKELYELEFIFLWKDGRIIDFNQMDHSFTLEIIEEDGILDDINTRTGNPNSN